jgi:hypothetical protein
MKRLLVAFSTLALVACNANDIEQDSSCAMLAADSDALMEAIADDKVVCIEGGWYVKLDPDKTYTYEEGKISATGAS